MIDFVKNLKILGGRKSENWNKSCDFAEGSYQPEKFSPNLKSLIKEWEAITKNWNVVEILTPTKESLVKEKEKAWSAWSKNQVYQPLFEYGWLKKNPIDIKATKKQLQTILEKTKVLKVKDEINRTGKTAFYQCVKDSLETLNLIEGLEKKNEKLIKEALNKKYAANDDYLWLLANSYYQQAVEKSLDNRHVENTELQEMERQLLREKVFNAGDLAMAFIWLLQKYNFLGTENKRGYQVIISDEATAVDVRDKAQKPLTIIIPATKTLSGEKLLCLMYRQIESKVRQSMNARALTEDEFELKTDDETWYEGCALRLENKFFYHHLFGEHEEEIVKMSFYVLAVNLAENGQSFWEIWQEITEMYVHVFTGIEVNRNLTRTDLTQMPAEIIEAAKEKAWTVTYRIMRGHTNMENKLAYANRKDLAYLRSYLVDEILNNMELENVDEKLLIKTNALPMTNEATLQIDNLAYPFLNGTRDYCFDVLLPQVRGEKTKRAIICDCRNKIRAIKILRTERKNNNRKDAIMHLVHNLMDDPYGSRESEKAAAQFVIPQKESQGRDVYNFLKDELLLDGNAKQNLTTFCTTWLEPEIHKLMNDSITKNLVDKDEYPQSAAIELRCVHMLADLWHSPEAKTTLGTSTIGSSEAAELGGLAMKWRWRKMREAAGKDTSKPNLVCGPVQVCWYKFARYFDVEIRSVPLTEERLEMTAESMMPYIDENTIGVVPTLGITYTCAYENVKDISDALDRIQTEKGWDIPIHVDAASGGFIAPFLQPDLLWDFRLPRVKSINTSGHKFGLSPLGVGWVVWRETKDLPEDLIFYVNYLGGNEATFNLNFSKPAGQVIAQYYNFLRLGKDGYTKIQSECAKVAKYVAEGVKKLGIFDILYDGEGGLPASCWSLKKDAQVPFNLFDITDRLRNRGWLLPSYSMPPNAQKVVIQRILCRHGFSMDMADLFLADFARTVEFLRQRGDCGSLSETEAASFKHT